MVGIKNFEMPHNCYDCELHNYHECDLTSESIEDDYCWNGDSREKHCPLVEAIPKAEYEARLKADMVAMLTDIQLEIEEQCKIPNNNASAYDWNNGVYACYKIIQQKIDDLDIAAEICDIFDKYKAESENS